MLLLLEKKIGKRKTGLYLHVFSSCSFNASYSIGLVAILLFPPTGDDFQFSHILNYSGLKKYPDLLEIRWFCLKEVSLDYLILPKHPPFLWNLYNLKLFFLFIFA